MTLQTRKRGTIDFSRLFQLRYRPKEERTVKSTALTLQIRKWGTVDFSKLLWFRFRG